MDSDWNGFSYFLSTNCPNTSYQVSSQLAFQFRRCKIDFQDDGHLGCLIRKILAIFYLQVAPIRPTKFRVNWLFGSGEEQNRFSRWWPSWISDWNDFIYF